MGAAMASTIAQPARLSVSLLRWLLLVALIPILILAALVQWHMEQRLVEQQQAHLYNLAREKSRLISEVSLATKSYLESLAERLRVAVESKAMMHPRSPVKGILTVSIGVALLDARACQHASEANLDGLYRLADEALYRAKHQGRNQVVLAREILGC